MKKKSIILGIIILSALMASASVYQYISHLEIMLEVAQQSNSQLLETLEDNRELLSDYQVQTEALDGSFHQLLDLFQNRLYENSEKNKELLMSEGDIINAHQIDTSDFVHIYSYDSNITTCKARYYFSEAYVQDQIAKLEDLEKLQGMNKLETQAFDELSVVLQHLSEQYFSFLPIEITHMTSGDEGIIVTINLSEMANSEDFPQYYSWKSGYFQGSSGGMYTEDTLIYNILQPDKSAWLIEAVNFTYEGSPINQFEHVPALFKTVTRPSIEFK